MTNMTRVLLVIAALAGLSACDKSGKIGGYDPDSPGADHTDWCSQSPPPGYCVVPDGR
jgi:hypothetical protein